MEYQKAGQKIMNSLLNLTKNMHFPLITRLLLAVGELQTQEIA